MNSIIDLMYSLFGGTTVLPVDVPQIDKVIYITCITIVLSKVVPLGIKIYKKIKVEVNLW